MTRTGVCVEFDNRDITITIGCMDKFYDLIGFGERFCEWCEGEDEDMQMQLSYEKGYFLRNAVLNKKVFHSTIDNRHIVKQA